MAINVNGLRFLLFARAAGVDFSVTATIGRQHLSLTREQFVGTIREEFGWKLPESELIRAFDEGFAEGLLRLLGAREIHSFDYSAFEQATHLHDFNLPLPQRFHAAYTVVLEGGTLEHVFDFPTAIRNCMEMVHPGGHFLSNAPANNYLGHGFYQFSPELYHRVLSPENGFAVEHQFLLELGDEARWFRASDPAAARRRLMLATSRPTLVLTMARRREAVPLFARPPQQGVYAAEWERETPFAASEAKPRRLTRFLPRRVVEMLRPPLRPIAGLLEPFDPRAAAAPDAIAVERCPVCGGGERRTLHRNLTDRAHGVPGVWSFIRCGRCGVIYLDPRPVDPATAYPGSYPQHNAPPAPPETRPTLKTRLRDSVLRAHGYPRPGSTLLGKMLLRMPGPRIRAFSGFPLLPRAIAGGRLLDVGCGNGRFLRVARSLGWDATGVETDPVSAAHARATGAEVHATMPDATFDVITLNHVLEHVADPLALLRQCAERLAPGGRIGIAVPNWTGLLHRLFRRSWFGLEPPRHLVMWDRRTLEATVAAAGLRVDSSTTIPAGRDRTEFAESWRLRFGTHPPRFVRALWPPLSVAATLVSRSFGEEVVVWASRPAQD